MIDRKDFTDHTPKRNFDDSYDNLCTGTGDMYDSKHRGPSGSVCNNHSISQISALKKAKKKYHFNGKYPKPR